MAMCPHLLIVEDRKNYQRLYELTFKEATDCHIDFATTGGKAISLLEKKDYDLVLLDLNLPDIQGEQVLRKIREENHDFHLPVIILTADANPDLQAKLLNLGADDFIEKGWPPEVLVARVMVQLRNKMSLDRAAELALEVDAFTTGVLHDIRNIEHNIVSLCYLTKMLFDEDPLENAAEISENLDALKQKASSISSYASDILDNVKQTHREVSLCEVDLNTVLSEIKPFIGSSERDSQNQKILLSENIEPIIADPQFLKLALLNIIQNSIKYTPVDRTAIVEIFTEKKDGYTILKIRDNGIGIPKDELDKVFEAFVRGKTHKDSKNKGYGLGLSMVSRAVRKMQGKIWAELREDGEQGTVMCIRLAKETAHTEPTNHLAAQSA